MSNNQEMDKVVERIEKLLRLAAANPNQEEAASAAAKAQELLAEHNLDLATVERGARGESGVREDAKVRGGLYNYQRDLWRAVAELNFCWYFTVAVPEFRKRTRHGANRTVMTPTHRLVGRKVNTRSSIVMAQYLEQAIERITRERLSAANGGLFDYRHLFSNWAVSFRKGAAEEVIRKIYDRREEVVEAEEAAQRDALDRAAASGTTATALITTSTVKEKENAGNYDFVHGDGAWARKQEREAQWEKEWAERRARDAKRRAEEEAAYAKWAAANPEEARKAEKKRARERERNAARRTGRRWSSGPRDNTDPSAFRAGREAGRDVSLDQQADDARPVGRIGHAR